jgi:tRNA1(Val) A37 N6-methylase TrmN6
MKFEKYSEQLIFDSTGENGIIKKFIHQKGIVFDVGANVGAWSKTVLEKYDQIQIHLFDPVLYNHKILENNLANWLEKENIYVNQIAVSNYERLQTFYSICSLERRNNLCRCKS